MNDNTYGYIDEKGDPVFRVCTCLGSAASDFLRSQNVQSYIDTENDPAYRDRSFYLGTKAKIPKAIITRLRNEDNEPAGLEVERTMVDARRIPLSISRKRISLGTDREIVDATRYNIDHRRVITSEKQPKKVERDEESIFQIRHEISHNWAADVCNDSIEI